MCEAVTDCMLTKGGVPDRPSSIVAIAYCISGGEGRREEGGGRRCGPCGGAGCGDLGCQTESMSCPLPPALFTHSQPHSAIYLPWVDELTTQIDGYLCTHDEYDWTSANH